MKFNIFSAVLLVCVAHSADAAVSPATVYSGLNLADSANTPKRSAQTSFGTNRISGPGEAMTTIGGDAAGTPFIQYLSTTPDTAGSTPTVTGWMRYSWEIVSADSTHVPVLVHISTAGWIGARYGFGPYRAGLNLPGDANSLDASVTARFQTQTTTGFDYRTYGLETGGVTWGGGSIRLAPEYHFAPQIGGYSSTAGRFSASFDLWVIPNTISPNYIYFDIYTAFRQNAPYIKDYAHEWYDSKGFIDPMITVDPAFSARFSVVQSSILMAPVPELSTLAMMWGGLAMLGCMAIRRHRT